MSNKPEKEDKNGHRIDNKGNLVFDERCHGCDSPKEEKIIFLDATYQRMENIRQEALLEGARKKCCEDCHPFKSEIENGSVECKYHRCTCHNLFPSWEEAEREAFDKKFRHFDFCMEGYGESVDYWIERIRLAREQTTLAVLQNIKDACAVAEMDGRSAALVEVEGMIEKHDYIRDMNVARYRKEILLALQALKSQ